VNLVVRKKQIQPTSLTGLTGGYLCSSQRLGGIVDEQSINLVIRKTSGLQTWKKLLEETGIAMKKASLRLTDVVPAGILRKQYTSK
jgi:hypothetical protein